MMTFVSATYSEMSKALEEAKNRALFEHHQRLHEHYRQALEEIIDNVLAGKQVTLMMGNKKAELVAAPKVEKKDGLVFHKDEAIRKSM